MMQPKRGRRARGIALVVAAIGALVAVALGWGNGTDWMIAYSYAAFASLAPAIGSLIFILIHRMTGGQWATDLLPFLAAGVALLPWIWVLTLPLLWLQSETFTPAPDATGLLRAYFHHDAVVLRSLGYGVVFFLFSIGTRRVVRSRDPAEMRWFGPVGLIVLTFMLHLLAVDWFVVLEPGWYSTGFGFVWMTGQAIAGLSTAIATGLLLGANPAEKGAAKRAKGLDWGNLLLAGIMSWTYVAFLQFLIIWSGNLPHEIAWYVHRGYGGWRVVAILLALLQFAAPFLLLLARELKQRAGWLAGIATLLLAGQFVYAAWLMLPAFPAARGRSLLQDVVLAIAVFAVFWNRYLASLRWPLAREGEAT